MLAILDMLEEKVDLGILHSYKRSKIPSDLPSIYKIKIYYTEKNVKITLLRVKNYT